MAAVPEEELLLDELELELELLDDELEELLLDEDDEDDEVELDELEELELEEDELLELPPLM